MAMAAAPSLSVLLSILIVAILLFYWYVKTKYSFWRKRGIRGPRPSFPFGTSLRPRGIGWHETDLTNVQKYGKVHGMYQGLKPALLVADQQMLQSILVRDFDAFSGRHSGFHKIQKQSVGSVNGRRWREQRNIITPTFTPAKMKAMHHIMMHAINNMTKHMDSEIAARGFAEFDNKELFGDLTLAVIAGCAFATDTNAHAKAGESVFHDNARRFFCFPKSRILMLALLPSFVSKFFQISYWPQQPLQFFLSMAETLISRRRGGDKMDGKNVDLLELLMNAEIKSDKGTDRLTDDEIIANIILVLIAGYDTTSILLVYATYSLAQNPGIQHRLRKEVEQVVERDGGEIRYETIMNLEYMDSVVNETLRRYPPVLKVERTTTRDYEFANGLKIPAGHNVYIPTFAIHHMEEYFADPFRFDPQRFLPVRSTSSEAVKPLSFLPFHAGPRNCIGARFALLEAKTALARLLLKYEMTVSPKTADPLDFSKCMFLMQSNDVFVRYSPRRPR